MRLHLIEVVQRFQFRVLVEEHPSLDPVRQERSKLVAGMLRHGDSENVVQFLESTLFGFYVEASQY